MVLAFCWRSSIDAHSSIEFFKSPILLYHLPPRTGSTDTIAYRFSKTVTSPFVIVATG